MALPIIAARAAQELAKLAPGAASKVLAAVRAAGAKGVTNVRELTAQIRENPAVAMLSIPALIDAGVAMSDLVSADDLAGGDPAVATLVSALGDRRVRKEFTKALDADSLNFDEGNRAKADQLKQLIVWAQQHIARNPEAIMEYHYMSELFHRTSADTLAFGLKQYAK